MRSLWIIAVTDKLAGFGREFQDLIDKGYKYAPAFSKVVKASKTVAGGK
jgi:hypothetical protein